MSLVDVFSDLPAKKRKPKAPKAEPTAAHEPGPDDDWSAVYWAGNKPSLPKSRVKADGTANHYGLPWGHVRCQRVDQLRKATPEDACWQIHPDRLIVTWQTELRRGKLTLLAYPELDTYGTCQSPERPAAPYVKLAA